MVKSLRDNSNAIFGWTAICLTAYLEVEAPFKEGTF